MIPSANEIGNQDRTSAARHFHSLPKGNVCAGKRAGSLSVDIDEIEREDGRISDRCGERQLNEFSYFLRFDE